MIVHINHLQPGQAAKAGEVVAALLGLVERGASTRALLPDLRIHLDWIQYRVQLPRGGDRSPRRRPRRRNALALAEVAVDLRRVEPARAGDGAGSRAPRRGPRSGHRAGRVWLEDWRPVRESIIWRFNDLFWQRVSDWEAAAGRGFEAALPSGQSDANHPQAVADAVAEFWTLLRELDKRGGLPAEIFALELGVGSGARAGLWLDRFRALDEERSTGYYPRLRFLLGDYSMPTLDRALAAVAGHREIVSVVPMDALNPLKTLSFLRYKVLYIHLTNVYDNLPYDELVRRDGRLYLVEARAWLPPRGRRAPGRDVRPRARRSWRRAPIGCSSSAPPCSAIGPAGWPSGVRSGTPSAWRSGWWSWPIYRQAPLPPGLDLHHLEELLRGRSRRRALSSVAGRGRELRQHAAAAAPARLLAGAGHLRDDDARVPAGLPGTGQARRLGGHLGQRRAAPRGGGPGRLRRALRAVSLSAGSRTSILYTTQRE